MLTVEANLKIGGAIVRVRPIGNGDLIVRCSRSIKGHLAERPFQITFTTTWTPASEHDRRRLRLLDPRLCGATAQAFVIARIVGRIVLHIFLLLANVEPLAQ